MTDAYRKAGVDVEAGYEAVNRMDKHITSTKRPEVLADVGGFGGMFDLSGFQLREPVLVSGTDGVGTKLMLAFAANQHDTIGIDAVAMCVNDIVVQGAEPLYFLDYIACGELEPGKIEEIVSGIAAGCRQSGATLIGGETAEMPGMYRPDDYDIAGFTVGLAEKADIITGENIAAGDVLIGLGSNGLHSNGFSLVRQIIADADLDIQAHYTFTQPLAAELLTPTRIYARPVLSVLQTGKIKGLAHITGGGFAENIPRMLPDRLGAVIDNNAWQKPRVFSFLQQYGGLSDQDMYTTFNMGIGLIAAVAAEDAKAVVEHFCTEGESAQIIGSVTEEDGVILGGERL